MPSVEDMSLPPVEEEHMPLQAVEEEDMPLQAVEEEDMPRKKKRKRIIVELKDDEVQVTTVVKCALSSITLMVMMIYAKTSI